MPQTHPTPPPSPARQNYPSETPPHPIPQGEFSGSAHGSYDKTSMNERSDLLSLQCMFW